MSDVIGNVSSVESTDVKTIVYNDEVFLSHNRLATTEHESPFLDKLTRPVMMNL